MKKKILSLLVLLVTAVTGAWAQGGIVCTASDKGKVLCTDGSIYNNVSAATTAGKTAVAKILVVDTENHKGLALALSDEGQMDYSAAKTACTNKNSSTPVTYGTWAIPSKDEWDQMISAAGGRTALRDGFNGIGGTNISNASMEEYWSSTRNTEYHNLVNWTYVFGEITPGWKSSDQGGSDVHVRFCLEFDLPIPTHNAALATGTPTGWSITPTTPEEGSTVTVAYTGTHRVKSVRVRGIPRVTAPTAVAASLTYSGSAQTLFNAGSTNLGTLKYKVTTTNSKPASTADFKTTIDQGTNARTYYLWYYVDGGENNKTTEVNGTAVTKAIGKATATLTCSNAAISFSSSEATNSTKTKTGVSCTGGTINVASANTGNCTVSYSSGTITVTRKNNNAFTNTQITVSVTPDGNHTAPSNVTFNVSAAANSKPASSATSSDVGKLIGADGKIYADATAATNAGTTARAKIVYVGSDNCESAPYNHGLALALSDANGGSTCQWKTENTDAGHTYKPFSWEMSCESGLQYNATQNSDTYPAFKAAISNNSTAAPTGCSAWFLASGCQWQKMANAAGGYDKLGCDLANYWCSSENGNKGAWKCDFSNGNWTRMDKYMNYRVRSCLAF